MADSPAMFDMLRRFTRSMGTSFDMNDVLYDLCDHAATILGATGAGVCVGTDNGELRFVTAIGDRTTEMERAQEKYQQGPCVEAFRSGAIVAVSDLDAAALRWPIWHVAAKRLDVKSVVGLPLALGERSLGALNVYNAEARPLTGNDLDAAWLLAEMAAAYLIRAGELADAKALSAQLQQALDSRVIIEQAKGMLARDHHISVEAAFALLRQHSRNTNVALRIVAQAVVELGLQIPSQPRS